MWTINTFLIPSLAYGMSFVNALASHRRKWDVRVAAAVSRCMGERGARKVQPEALACITGLILPSHYERMTRVSDCFFRLNDLDARAASARRRWVAGERARTILRYNRLGWAKGIAVGMGVILQSVVRSNRLWIEDASTPAGGCRLHTEQTIMAFGHYGLWGNSVQVEGPVVLFTDGSAQGSKSSWSVCALNEWLETSFTTVPGERELSRHHLRNACMIGSALYCSEGSGVFVAELQAIARAIMGPPASAHLVIYSDSLSAIQAISTFASLRRQRARLRAAGRPLLTLITRLIALKESKGSSVRFVWIRAHSDVESVWHVGNRCADFAAKQACTGRPHLRIRALPLDQEECFLSMRDATSDPVRAPVLGDPRRFCMRALRKMAVAEWASSSSQSLFSALHSPAHGLWRHVCSHHPALVNFTLRMLSDTLQWRVRDGIHEERRCRRCQDVTFSVAHLITCPRVRFERAGATVAIYRVLSRCGSLGTALHQWRDGGDYLRDVLVRVGVLVAVSPAAEVGPMVGVLDSRQVKGALARWEVRPEQREPLFNTLRSILIDWPAKAWRRIYDC